MSLIHHPAVASDIAKAIRWYRKIDSKLADDFVAELKAGFSAIEKSPARSHFDSSGWRRLNLRRFPYHVLFREELQEARVMLVRHHQQDPEFGVKRR